MASRQRYRELLENIREADRRRKKAYQEAGSWRSKDKKAVAKAKKELDEYYRHVRILYVEHLERLTRQFLAGDTLAIDEIIEFLAVDLRAFRSGYAKETYYRKLKQLELSADQSAKIREIALQRCASSDYRRDDSELRRLMIRLADVEFLNRVAAIPSRFGSRIERHKQRMFQVVLSGRKDLRQLLESSKLRGADIR